MARKYSTQGGDFVTLTYHNDGKYGPYQAVAVNHHKSRSGGALVYVTDDAEIFLLKIMNTKENDFGERSAVNLENENQAELVDDIDAALDRAEELREESKSGSKKAAGRKKRKRRVEEAEEVYDDDDVDLAEDDEEDEDPAPPPSRRSRKKRQSSKTKDRQTKKTKRKRKSK